MFTYCPMAKIKTKYPDDPMDKLFTYDSFLGFKTAWSQFAIWKSMGFEMVEAWIDAFDGDKKVQTYKVDLSKI